MKDGRDFSSAEVIETLVAALVERYGDEALAVALRQAALAEGLPQQTWEEIVGQLRARGIPPGRDTGPDVDLSASPL